MNRVLITSIDKTAPLPAKLARTHSGPWVNLGPITPYPCGHRIVPKVRSFIEPIDTVSQVIFPRDRVITRIVGARIEE